jgi:hypothetical protein
VWRDSARCKEATAYRSPDFSSLVVRVPETGEVYFLDLDRSYAGLPDASNIIFRENVAILRAVPPPIVGPPKWEAKIEWVEPTPGTRYVQVGDRNTTLRIYYYR